MNWVFGAAILVSTDHGRWMPPKPRLVDVDAGVGSVEYGRIYPACVACVRV